MISAEVHLWCVDLEIAPHPDADPASDLDTHLDADLETDLGNYLGRVGEALSPDERARAARFVFARHRRRFVAARTALRSILAAWVGIPAGELEFVYGAHQKPALAPWCRGTGVSFNLSHSRGLALVALTHGPEIGVDLEQVRRFPDADALVAGEFRPAERTAFEALPADARTEAFFRAWVRKEAFLKATGEGLYRPLADIEVTFAPGQAARLLAVGGDTSAARRWSMTEVLPQPGYVAAVVAAAPAIELALHGFGAVAGSTPSPAVVAH
jgi:4'-phosphopantetheinyl transferase